MDVPKWCCLLFLLHPATATAQQYATLQGDTALIRVATVVTEHAEAADGAWPGFWRSPRFAVHRGGGPALLITDGAPFPGAVQVREPSLPPGWVNRAYVVPGEAIPTGGMVKRGDPTPYILDLADIHVPAVPFLLHEAFHMWQLSFFDNRPFSFCVPQSLPAAMEEPGQFSSELASEIELLARAVLADSSTRKTSAAAYLEARRGRLAKRPPELSFTEQRQERIEGTAEFVGESAAMWIRDGSVMKLPDTLAARLRRTTALINIAAEAGRAPDPRTAAGHYWYQTGAALAEILDALNVEDWRQKVTRGSHLDELLAEHLGHTGYATWVAERPDLRSLCPAGR
jgi:hypothetical protein